MIEVRIPRRPSSLVSRSKPLKDATPNTGESPPWTRRNWPLEVHDLVTQYCFKEPRTELSNSSKGTSIKGFAKVCLKVATRRDLQDSEGPGPGHVS